jgi:ABC-2 type transport system permease protein
MRERLLHIESVFRIHLARVRREAGPFILAAVVFPVGMYFFASGIAGENSDAASFDRERVRFLAASIVFSLSLTSISWFGYLLLENRFTGRLKLFATLPVAPSSYIFGVLIFVLAQGFVGTAALLIIGRLLGVSTQLSVVGVSLLSAVVLVSVLALGGLSVIISTIARSFSEGSLMTDALGAGMVLLAPVYYPPDALPIGLRQFAMILPTTYLARSVERLLMGDPSIGFELIVLAGFALLTLACGFRAMNWRKA